MQDLQLICVEVTNKCNLAFAHSKFCPSSRRHNNRQAAKDSDFLDFIAYCVSLGFKGRIGFHFYSEPTLDIERCKRLNTEIHKMGLKTVMWTNGTSTVDLSDFDSIFATQYIGKELGDKKIPYDPDNRLHIYDQKITENLEYRSCCRPSHVEMPIDYWGDVHMCCGDWDGKVEIGNIMTTDYSNIIDNWRLAIEAADCGFVLCRQCQCLTRSPAIYDKTYKM